MSLQKNTTELQAILAAVNALPEAGGGVIPAVLEPLEVTENGEYTPPEGVDGFSSVLVNVASSSSSFPNGRVFTKSNVSDPMCTVHFSDGIWVAGSGANMDSFVAKGIYYSSDGKTWIQSNLTDTNIMFVHGENGMWVAGSYQGGIYYSTDGKLWTQTNVTSGDFRRVGFCGGKWYAGGHSGLYYSTDGMVWNPTSITGSNCLNFSYANGIWYCGSGSDLRYSTDGINFNNYAIFDRIGLVVYAKGKWVACSNKNKGFYYSSDGITWTQSNVTTGSFTEIVYANGIFVAAPSSSYRLHYSEDGMTWTKTETLPSGAVAYGGTYYANGMWICGSYFSTDGKVWSKITDEQGIGLDNGAVFNANGIWVHAEDGLSYSVSWEA